MDVDMKSTVEQMRLTSSTCLQWKPLAGNLSFPFLPATSASVHMKWRTLEFAQLMPTS